MPEEDPLVSHKRQVAAEVQAKTVEVRNALKLTPAPEVKEEAPAPSPETAPVPQAKEEEAGGWGMVDRIQSGPKDEKAAA
jgi:hypothetical protein